MKNHISLRIFAVLLFSVLLYSCSPKISRKLNKEKTFEQGFTGLYIYDPEYRKAVYEYNSSKYFTPASNTKILTFFAAIKYLEDSLTAFRYALVQDSLFFSANGDPTFLNPNFSSSRAFDFLKESDKELVYVPSHYNDKIYGPGWAWDDYQYSFSAGKSAFPVYGNLVNLKYSSEEGIETIPEYFKDSVQIKRNSPGRISNKNIFFLDPTRRSYKRNIPFIPSESLSIKLLQDTLNKPIYTTRKNKVLNREFKSIPADSVYKHMLKESDNFIAEQLLLMISNKVKDTLETSIAIKTMQNEFFQNLPDEIFWVDGSGLSRYNLATPKSMVNILEDILKLKGEDYVKELFPEAGKEGTLENFLKSEKPFVYAKSGSLRNNYSLSGYLFTKNGKLLIFSFMNSNYTVPTQMLKDSMEEILIMVRDHY